MQGHFSNSSDWGQTSMSIIPYGTSLIGVKQIDDGGVRNLTGIQYQYHFAVYKCLKMLIGTQSIEYVACELHDDVIVRRTDEIYEFYQVKTRQDDPWKMIHLRNEGVWKKFIDHRELFGQQHVCYFVTDQSVQNVVSKKPDLGKMKQLTQMGKSMCNRKDLDDADELIAKLKSLTGVKDDEVIQGLFWGTRIIANFERQTGLIYMNLNLLEELLTLRGIPCDLENRTRIYRQIISAMQSRIVEVLPEATIQQQLECRIFSRKDIDLCITGPFRDARLANFEFASDPEYLSLRQKSERRRLPDNLIRNLIELRIYFLQRSRDDIIVAPDYLNQLRLKVLATSQSARMVSSIGQRISLKDVWDALDRLAQDEIECKPPVRIDAFYLRGILCQLTSECINDWEPIMA
jgi:hypothetical protein